MHIFIKMRTGAFRPIERTPEAFIKIKSILVRASTIMQNIKKGPFPRSCDIHTVDALAQLHQQISLIKVLFIVDGTLTNTCGIPCHAHYPHRCLLHRKHKYWHIT
jgi:hypothetical protein